VVGGDHFVADFAGARVCFCIVALVVSDFGLVAVRSDPTDGLFGPRMAAILEEVPVV
jgi:hypothetical protein